MKRGWWIIWLATGATLLGAFLATRSDALSRERAASFLSQADDAELLAERLQHIASERNRAALAARRAARLERSDANIKRMAAAVNEEAEAYQAAGDAWGRVADLLESARLTVKSNPEPDADRLRIRLNAARIGAGQFGHASADLEELVRRTPASEHAAAAREQLARAYFHGALLSRQAGKPEDDWRLISERARQHARVLAQAHGPAQARHQRNLETILDFERLPLADLEGAPLPSDCTGNCNNPKLDDWPWNKGSKRLHGSPPSDNRRLGGGAGGGNTSAGGS
jgi:hypothetical protein